VRSFGDLTPAEQAKVAEMTGITVEEIEANLTPAAYDYADEEDEFEADAAANAEAAADE
jgi:hypothetical protein